MATNSFNTFGDVKEITPYTDSNNRVYTAILIPTHDGETAVTPHSKPRVKFVVDGEALYWDLKDEVLKAGDNNKYNVKITRTGVTATGSITDWVPVEKEDVVAE